MQRLLGYALFALPLLAAWVWVGLHRGWGAALLQLAITVVGGAVLLLGSWLVTRANARERRRP